jgi:hypothetical protein
MFPDNTRESFPRVLLIYPFALSRKEGSGSLEIVSGDVIFKDQTQGGVL